MLSSSEPGALVLPLLFRATSVNAAPPYHLQRGGALVHWCRRLHRHGLKADLPERAFTGDRWAESATLAGMISSSLEEGACTGFYEPRLQIAALTCAQHTNTNVVIALNAPYV